MGIACAFRTILGVGDHGKYGSARPDGGCGSAVVGPAHGSKWNFARIRRGPAAVARKGLAQSSGRFRGRHGTYGTSAKQYGNRPDRKLVCGGRVGWPGPGACGHARSQRRHHADRTGSVVQYCRHRARPLRSWPGCLPRRASLADQGFGPRLNRSWADATVAAHSAGHAGSRRRRPRRPRRHAGNYGRSRVVHRDRRRHHLGGAFQRGQRPPDYVAGLLSLHYTLRRLGAGARRQSRQCDQSSVRGRAPRSPGKLSAAARQPSDPRHRHHTGRALPASAGRVTCSPCSPISANSSPSFTSPSTSGSQLSSLACWTAWQGF